MTRLTFRKDLANTSNKESWLRFRVNDTDIVGTDHISRDYDPEFSNKVNHWYPIIHFALSGLKTMKALGVARKAWLEDVTESGEDLLFKIVGDRDVVVINAHTDETAQVDYSVLLSAWTSFAQEVHDYVIQKFPEAVTRFDWKWLSEMPSPSEIKMIHDGALYIARSGGYEL